MWYHSLIVVGLLGIWGPLSIGQAMADPQSKQGLSIAPVPLDLHGKKNLVGLGSYLVNAVGGCNDCHTWNPALAPDGSYAEGGNPFAGQEKKIDPKFYLSGGRFFFSAPYPIALNGCVISRNITPFEDGKPAGLTLDQFIHVIRTGEDPDDKNVPPRLLQVMPWPVYQDMTDGDLRAIYAYLSAIPAVQGEPTCPPPAP